MTMTTGGTPPAATAAATAEETLPPELWVLILTEYLSPRWRHLARNVCRTWALVLDSAHVDLEDMPRQGVHAPPMWRRDNQTKWSRGRIITITTIAQWLHDRYTLARARDHRDKGPLSPTEAIEWAGRQIECHIAVSDVRIDMGNFCVRGPDVLLIAMAATGIEDLARPLLIAKGVPLIGPIARANPIVPWSPAISAASASCPLCNAAALLVRERRHRGIALFARHAPHTLTTGMAMSALADADDDVAFDTIMSIGAPRTSDMAHVLERIPEGNAIWALCIASLYDRPLVHRDGDRHGGRSLEHGGETDDTVELKRQRPWTSLFASLWSDAARRKRFFQKLLTRGNYQALCLLDASDPSITEGRFSLSAHVHRSASAKWAFGSVLWYMERTLRSIKQATSSLDSTREGDGSCGAADTAMSSRCDGKEGCDVDCDNDLIQNELRFYVLEACRTPLSIRAITRDHSEALLAWLCEGPLRYDPWAPQHATSRGSFMRMMRAAVSRRGNPRCALWLCTRWPREASALPTHYLFALVDCVCRDAVSDRDANLLERLVYALQRMLSECSVDTAQRIGTIRLWPLLCGYVIQAASSSPPSSKGRWYYLNARALLEHAVCRSHMDRNAAECAAPDGSMSTTCALCGTCAIAPSQHTSMAKWLDDQRASLLYSAPQLGCGSWTGEWVSSVVWHRWFGMEPLAAPPPDEDPAMLELHREPFRTWLTRHHMLVPS